MPNTFAPDALTPDAALARLREGNRRFVSGDGNAVRQWQPGLVDGQQPFAVVLGCADSRTPAEYVFDQGLGDLFVIRVAGNIVAPSLTGSVEFAASQFGTRLVVVMGHTHCGAVRATVRSLTHEDGPDSSNQRSIIDRIAPHLQGVVETTLEDEERMAQAVRINALASASELRSSSELLHGLVEKGRVRIVAAVYDLATGVVEFLED
jgi:carbonic anhydrase